MSGADSVEWQQVSGHLDRLLDLAEPECETYLLDLERREPALAGRVRRVLGARRDVRFGKFLADVAAPAPEQVAAAALIGRSVGPYVIEAQIGYGGMGSVWRARRSDGRFEGEAAIKLLRRGLFDTVAQERFRREGAILARLRHPGIAQLLDAGITPDGQPYLVLELVRGLRIDRWCEARALDVRRRVDLFLGVLDAVAAAHAQLVIHRDLKPSNILVDDDGRIKLLDFGIARLLSEPDEPGLTMLTREGAFALTPEYAAPEQFAGRSLSTATDVFALGIVLYELLVGAHPTGLAAGSSPLDYLRAADQGVFVKPGGSFRELRGDLENILAKALRTEAGERYPTVGAFAHDLQAYLAHRPVAARPDSAWYRLGKFARRNRLGVSMASLAAAAVIAGVTGTLLQSHRAAVERDNALRELTYTGAASELLSYLVGASASQPMTSADLLAKAEQMVGQRFKDDAETRGRLEFMLGMEYHNAFDLPRAAAVLRKGEASARAALRPILQSNIECALAMTMNDQHESAAALKLFDTAIRRLIQGGPGSGAALGSCLVARADVDSALGDPDAELADSRAGIAAIGSEQPIDKKVLEELQVTEANAYSRLGRMAEAVSAYGRLVDQMTASGTLRSSAGVWRLANFGEALYRAGQTARARAVFGQTLDVVNGLGPAEAQAAIVRCDIARALIELGRADDAKPPAQAALASTRARHDDLWTGLTALYAAPAWCQTGDLARCEALLDEAEPLLNAEFPGRHQILAIIKLERARLALARSDRITSLDLLRRATEEFGQAREYSPHRIRARALLAITEAETGDTASAVTDARMAVDDARRVLAGVSGSQWLGIALAAQAIVLQSTGAPEAGRAAHAALAELRDAWGDAAPALAAARASLAFDPTLATGTSPAAGAAR